MNKDILKKHKASDNIMHKNYKLKLLSGISAITLLSIALVNDSKAQAIDYKVFYNNVSGISSAMSTLGNWSQLRNTSLQGISGKTIRSLKTMHANVVTLEQQWQTQNISISKLSSTEKLAIYNSQLYRDWETDRKSTRLNSSHSAKSRMPSSA